MIQRNKTVFVYGNKVPFASDADWLKNVHNVKEADKDYDRQDNMAVIVGEGYICLDCDGAGSHEFLSKLSELYGVQETYKYKTRHKSKGKKDDNGVQYPHYHWWFKATSREAKEIISIFKLNSARGHIHPSIDTRAWRWDKDQNKALTGKVFLKQQGKQIVERPRPIELAKGLSEAKEIPWLMLMPTKLGIPKKTGEGWSESALKIASNFKNNGLSFDLYNSYMREYAVKYGEKHNTHECKHKWEDSKQSFGIDLKGFTNSTLSEIEQLTALAEIVIKRHNIMRTVSGQTYYTLNNVVRQIRSQKSWGFLIKLEETSTLKELQKVSQTIEILLDKNTIDAYPLDKTKIVFPNGYYCLKELKFIEGKQIPALNMMKYNYNPNIDTTKLKNILINNQKWNSNKKLAHQIIEMWAHVICPWKRANKLFWLKGKGGEGKSWFISILQNAIGLVNYSTLKLNELEGHYTHEMTSKIANLVTEDVATGEYISKIEMVKQIVSNEPTGINPKGKDKYSIVLNLTMVSAGNQWPRMKEALGSSAFMDRLQPIEFDFDIRETEHEDLSLNEWGKTEECAQQLYKIALTFMPSLINNEGRILFQGDVGDFMYQTMPVFKWAIKELEPKVLDETISLKDAAKSFRSFLTDNYNYERKPNDETVDNMLKPCLKLLNIKRITTKINKYENKVQYTKGKNKYVK